MPPKTPSNTVSHSPFALFMGDFNVGKSTIINALLRRELLRTSREESRALPTFIARSTRPETSFAAMGTNGKGIASKTHEEFLDLFGEAVDKEYTALAARYPAMPFNRLVLVDTPGISSDTHESVRLNGIAHPDTVIFVVVTDIEYWSAKHTMEFIAFHQSVFGQSLLVLGNKADHLNAAEIRRVRDKAVQRLESFGVKPAPRFLPLSARLELARGTEYNEYRHRTKQEVRDLCDGGFDALRVALYEFETSHTAPSFPTFEELLQAPLAASFLRDRGLETA